MEISEMNHPLQRNLNFVKTSYDAIIIVERSQAFVESLYQSILRISIDVESLESPNEFQQLDGVWNRFHEKRS